MIRRFSFGILSGLFILTSLFSLYSLSIGRANILTSINIHILIFLSLDCILRKAWKEWSGHGLRVSWWTLFIMLLLCEFVLRYGTRNNLSYGERNGNFHYLSPFHTLHNAHPLSLIYPDRFDRRFRLYNAKDEFYSDKPEFSYRYTTNELGMVDRTHLGTELDSSLQILALGDSYTQGVGAPQDSSWPALLEDIIQTVVPNAIVANGAQAGSDLVFECFKFKERLDSVYNPDILILGLNNTDLLDLTYRGGPERFGETSLRNTVKAPWWDPFYTFSHSARMLVHHLLNVKWHHFTEREYEERIGRATEAVWRELLECFLPLSREQEFKMVVLIHSSGGGQFGPRSVLEPLIDRIEEHPEMLLIDFDEELRKLPVEESDLLYWPIDRHHTSEGYRLMAEFAAAELLKAIPDLAGPEGTIPETNE